ncbi:helix-turn-helix domain-containing protein [Streptomyces sp. WAC07061]|uniref:AraC-like ligand-binding domain-containing protein n=1 Tax=Streptomyces sp. WAC07061 TaxID=2487410 RepID=UPI000F766888|nr:helix-turn-helix domain-containing protein [Streptomyces sp. WAC07061]RSS57976.1 helix-turn-helix domain-containing protein [Streptomyces sp. WAC07061]
MGTLVASEVVGAREDRFDWFCETVSSHVMPVLLSSRHTADFRADITEVDLGAVRLSAMTCSPVRSRRTMTHVRQGDPEHLQLALLTRGALRISQRGNESVVSGGLVLTDTSRPSEAACADETLTSVVLQIPRQALPLGADRLDGLLARNLPADSGSGAVVADFMRSLLARAPHCRPEELHGLGAVTLDLATAFLAGQLGEPGATPAEARARETLQRIHRFIEHNLGDPDLTPRLIADRHNMSLRGLHALFAGQPLTLAAHIRRSRLERARTDLARAEFGGHPVQAIAARWGFTSATGFSRAFREAYGLTPTEHRAFSLGAAPHAEHRNPARHAHQLVPPAPRFTCG